MINNIHKLKTIYFTTLPTVLYNSGTNNGNMGIAGIGLGLMRYKQFFWVANISVCSSCLVLYKNNINNIYFLMFLCASCSAFYIYLFIKTFNLIRYLDGILN